ncbi:hypothetical protein D0T49_04460 [Paludibacter sp. 221]|uniref:hypothetical protein n=1 Tax=Paludibacter sp. 221 TaxID=2302939 RepID=UPI0013D1B00A|nr:hypothetical protein [Paludibacter sp. 221]NDV46289.1 hypothetical protein [Paludibacter sp. 221]
MEPSKLTYEEIQAIASEIRIQAMAVDYSKPKYMSRKSAYKIWGEARVKRIIASGRVRCSNTQKGTDIRVEDIEREIEKQEYLEGIKGVPKQIHRKK